MHLLRIAGLVGALTLLIDQSLLAADDSRTLATQAKAAYDAKRFDQALDLYLKSYLAGQKGGDVRDQIHDCFRRTAQVRRHTDPAFRQYILSLTVSDALTLYGQIVQKLSTHHADKDKATPEKLFALSLQEIERALANAKFRKQNLPLVEDTRLTRFVKSLQQDWPQRLPTSHREARAALQELVRNALSELHLTEPTALILEAICGACGGLDEATAYSPPATENAADAESTIARAEMTDPMAGVGIIVIRKFRDTTPAEFEQALQPLRMAGLRSLILDLRGNPGGNFVAALRLAERFVPQGQLVATTGQLPEFDQRIFASSSGMAALGIPLVVLVDGKTMSAAEVFACAVKESGRGTLIGMNTYGKGSVQSVVPLDGETPRAGTLMVTIAKVIGANGTPLTDGVTPHVKEPDPMLQSRLAQQRATALAEAMR